MKAALYQRSTSRYTHAINYNIAEYLMNLKIFKLFIVYFSFYRFNHCKFQSKLPKYILNQYVLSKDWHESESRFIFFGVSFSFFL